MLYPKDLQDFNINKYDSLNMHLTSNFYPPIPNAVKKIFLDAFNLYWSYKIDIEGLQKELSRVYKGSLYQYHFNDYLNDDDIDIDY